MAGGLPVHSLPAAVAATVAAAAAATPAATVATAVGINALDVSDWDTTAAGPSVVTNAAGTNATGTALSEVEEILFSRKWKRRCSFPAKSLGPISPTF